MENTANVFAGIAVIGVWIIAFFVLRTLLYWCMKKDLKVLGLLITIMTFAILFVGAAAYISASAKISKERDIFYNEIAAMPSDEKVDELIRYIGKYGCINTPQAWNQLRGVWFAVNASPNVTTAKKNEVKSFLMLRGLSIHHNDAKVINNYRG